MPTADPVNFSVDPRFIKGLELFNHGEYYECHEVIEDLWLETDKKDPYRDLYKGVIQAAAAVYQFQRTINSGALGLYRSSVEYLDKYQPETLGLDVTTLINQMKICFATLNSCSAKKSEYRLDASLVPRLKYRV